MIPWKLIAGGVAAGLLAVAAIAAVKAWNAGQDARACLSAFADPGSARPASLKRCTKPAAAAIAAARADAEIARKSEACASGLQRDGETGRWLTPLACPQGVQDLSADQAARLGEVKSRDAQIRQLKADQSAAINRAAARAADRAKRESNAERLIPTLPDAGGDRRRCDAECLRRLTGG